MGNRLLIIDGEKKLREYLVRYFNNLNLETNGIDNYEYAMNILCHHQYDFVIIDFFIGDDCAEYLCEWLNNRKGERTHLIITNQSHTYENEIKIRKLSPLFYFVKPYDIEDLRSVLEKANKCNNIEISNPSISLQEQNHEN